MKTTDLLLAGALAATACRARHDELLEASHRVIFESVTALGSHHLEASLTSTASFPVERTTSETLDLRWGDWQNFQVRWYREGQLVAENLVIQGEGWTRSGGRFRPARDPEILRVELSQNWGMWNRALRPFAERLHFEAAGDEVVEGRRARRYEISLAPPGEADDGGPNRIEGWMVVDQATAVRLLGELRGHYVPAGDPQRARDFHLHLARSGIGEIPRLDRPKVRHRRR